MKHNLKNRPIPLPKPNGRPFKPELMIKAYEEWFEEFEKELRELVKQISYANEFPDPLDVLKEILGGRGQKK